MSFFNVKLDRSSLDELIRETWRKYDTNEDGYLQINEAKNMFTDLYEASNCFDEKTFEQIFAIFDANADGKISKDEFKNTIINIK